MKYTEFLLSRLQSCVNEKHRPIITHSINRTFMFMHCNRYNISNQQALRLEVTCIIAFGLPNLVTDLLGIGHVTVWGIQNNKIRVKQDISPRSRRSGTENMLCARAELRT